MSDTKRFRVNDRECAAKVIDGEAVIINLLNGTYYGLDNAGGAMWELLADGHVPSEVAPAIAARYDVDEAQALADATRLLDELVAEKLLVESTLGAPTATTVTAAEPDARAHYDTPMLTTYRDMAELLALDPPMPRLEDIVWSESGENAPEAR